MSGNAAEIFLQYRTDVLKIVSYDGMKTCCHSARFTFCNSCSMGELPVTGGTRILDAVDGTHSNTCPSLKRLSENGIISRFAKAYDA